MSGIKSSFTSFDKVVFEEIEKSDERFEA